MYTEVLMSKVNVLLLNGISLAIENVLRLSPHLLRISLSDLGLSSESLTLTFIMSSKARASGNILTCQRKCSSCPFSIQVFNDPSVLGEVCRCPPGPGREQALHAMSSR